MIWQLLYAVSLRARARPGLAAAILTKLFNFVFRYLPRLGIDPQVTTRVRDVPLVLNASHMLPRYVIDHPYYDTVLPALARFLLDAGPADLVLSILDVGANVGDSTALTAAACGNGRVRFLCIEADPANIALLERNVAGLGATVIAAVAGEATGEIEVDFVRGQGTSSVVMGGGRKLRSLRLDDLPTISDVDLVKIDVDGFEHQVLKGLSVTLSQHSPLILFEYHPNLLKKYGKTEPLEVLRFLKGCGYCHAAVWDNSGYPVLLMDIAGNDARYLTRYCTLKPDFYLDFLVAKDREILEAFFSRDTPKRAHDG